MKTNKVRIAALSVASNALLTAMKLIVGFVTGSVSILSEAIHSSIDLIAAGIAFFSVRVSDKPADREHPYGHGKIENVSGVVEGVLIFFAAALIVEEAIQKIIKPHEVSQMALGVAVMAVSAVINAVVSALLYRTAKREESVALEADALHLKTDVVTSAGVAAGLVLIAVTNISLFDPIVALFVALLIVKEAWHLVTKAFSPLLDAGLNNDETERIHQVLQRFSKEMIDYHALRTRRSGRSKFIDFHITLPGAITLAAAHDLTDRIEAALEADLKQTSVTIHMEPKL